MRRLLETQAVALAQVVSKKARKRAVTHDHLHLPQQQVLDGHRVPEGHCRGRVRGVGGHQLAGQHVAQRIDEH